MSRIGMFVNLAEDDPEVKGRIDALRSGLPSGNVDIVPNYGAGKTEAYQRIADELVALGPDVLFAACGPSLWALQVATRTIPIVFAGVIDPVTNGCLVMGDGDKITGFFADNVTGFISYRVNQCVQSIDTLRTIAPDVTRLTVMWDPSMRAGMVQLGAIMTVVHDLEIDLTLIDVRGTDDKKLGDAVEKFAKKSNGKGGLIVPGGTWTATRRKRIIQLAAKHKLPAVYSNSLYVRSGGLISYGADTLDLYKQAGDYVGQILAGADPSSLPVKPNGKFETCINQSTAGELGIPVPPDLAAGSHVIP